MADGGLKATEEVKHNQCYTQKNLIVIFLKK